MYSIVTSSLGSRSIHNSLQLASLEKLLPDTEVETLAIRGEAGNCLPDPPYGRWSHAA